jgi:heptose I phosphotransferase
MSRGTFSDRLFRGVRWAWMAESHRDSLPDDLADSVMAIESSDRHHAKQGRSTARVRFDRPDGTRLSVYLKRHDRLPWISRVAAVIAPGKGRTPATVEWSHLARAESLGIPVPEVVAAGEWIGPWGELRGFLMVKELGGAAELNVALPRLWEELPAPDFSRLKRELIREMAEIAARLHRANSFHKDLYLCHFFLDGDPSRPAGSRLTLIDLHRLGEHRWTALRWRWKDLGQLLFSTVGVAGIDDRDRLRFWLRYRKLCGLRAPRWQFRAVRAKARRYLEHNA